MQKAIKEAGISPGEVDYVNAHATSTPQGDLSEVAAIEKIFGDSSRLHISGTKSMTGHLLGGAGALEAVICILSLQNGVIPPTINTKNLDDAIPRHLNFVLGEAVKADLRYAMNNTFGFGGHTASTLFKKFEG
jgi:3-oxoacyl-[acyl-carrier-protein] synthase II